jgi:GT2 family glycosyltransferase
VFQPPPWVDSHLPYLDDSVDLVLVGDDRPPITDEAVRVARVAVLRVMGSAHDRSVRVAWQADNAAGGEARVSIVIPTLNRGNVLHACLRSLRETVPSGVPIEVIVVDDGSEQDDRADLETACRAFGVTLLRNERNTGFVASVNRGASAASGAYLLFLNDDTVLLPGWLPPLLRVFRARSDAGAVGGKLVYPDGRLMEAGGIVYSDGSGANYGKFDANPEAPLYCYLRDVDYVSGAMLMTPRALFEQLGGFDAVFGFGFYEDTDYCFRVREAGRRVYYQPASVIVHREGVSAGTDIRHGAKHFQARNRPIFVDRWRSQLGTQAAPP